MSATANASASVATNATSNAATTNAAAMSATTHARDALQRSRATLRLGEDSVDVPTLLAHGRDAWQAHADRRTPALAGIDSHAQLARLLAALADDRRVVLCPPDAPLPPGCDARIGADASASMRVNADTDTHARDDARAAGGFAVLSSGTLGAPKRIWHRADALFATGDAVRTRFELSARERVLIAAPAHHLYGLGAALVPALLADADILLLPRAHLLAFNDALRAFRPAHVFATPHLLRQVLQRRHQPQPGCRGVVLAGDAVPALVRERAPAVFGALRNLYGSSELGVIAIARDDAPDALVPLPGVRVAPSDPALARSTLRVRHPHAATHLDCGDGPVPFPQEWDTRDVVAFADDGSFALHGRADLAVNRAGRLVLLQDIERVAMDWPGVGAAVAVVAEADAIAGRAVALIVRPTDATLTVDALRGYAQRDLPHFARPDRFAIAPDLPCLPSGKPDRNAITQEYRHG